MYALAQATAPAALGAGETRPAPDIRLRGVRKTYGEVVAVAGIDLEVAARRVLHHARALGLGQDDDAADDRRLRASRRGHGRAGGRDVGDLPPYDREVNTVFQDYALFPHMSVGENVEYGMRVRKVAKDERARRRDEALEMVRLGGYADRKPSELSGGQRQRVALARSIVNRPRVLLLDEPLGALDLKLREQMQVELKEIQGEVGITFVYVTHDQEEALTMSDRIAVFNEGRVEQVGTPAEIYETPRQRLRRRLRRRLQRARARRAQVHDPPGEDQHARARRAPPTACTPRAAASATSPTRG